MIFPGEESASLAKFAQTLFHGKHNQETSVKLTIEVKYALSQVTKPKYLKPGWATRRPKHTKCEKSKCHVPLQTLK